MTFVVKILANDELWYHGRSVKNREFDLNHVGKGHDVEGPGFYFSRKKEDAERYMGTDGILMTVRLHPKKLVPLDKKPKQAELLKMIKAAPDFEDTLQGWDESPAKALSIVLGIFLKKNAKDAFESIWYDFYRYEPALYLKNMVNLVGYDGNLAERTGDHIVIYDPDVIEVVSVEE